MTLIIVLLLILSYLLIATGHLTGVNKGAIAIFLAAIGWVVYICWGTDFVMALHPGAYAEFLGDTEEGGNEPEAADGHDEHQDALPTVQTGIVATVLTSSVSGFARATPSVCCGPSRWPPLYCLPILTI